MFCPCTRNRHGGNCGMLRSRAGNRRSDNSGAFRSRVGKRRGGHSGMFRLDAGNQCGGSRRILCRTTRKRHGGFTLVELLSALTLGALLIAALLKLHHNAQWAHAAAANRAAVAQKLIVMRRAVGESVTGIVPACGAKARRFNLMTAAAPAPFWLKPFESAVRVVGAGDSGAPDGLKRAGDRPGERSAQSDVLIVRGAALPAVSVSGHATDTRAFVVSDTAGFRTGDAALICDEHAAALFQVTDVGAHSLGYGGGGVQPGNCAGAFAAGGCAQQHRFGDGAVIARYAASVFYVGVGKSGGGFSLYRQRPGVVRAGAVRRLTLSAEEIITGVRRMAASVVVRQGGRLRHANAGGGDGGGSPFAIALEVVISGHTGPGGGEESHAFVVTL